MSKNKQPKWPSLEDFIDEVYALSGKYCLAGFSVSVVRAEGEDLWVSKAKAEICPHPAFLPYKQMIYSKMREYSVAAIEQAEKGVTP